MKQAEADARAFLDGLPDDRRADAKELARLMREATGKPARLWGASIVGFGERRYRYESGREGDTFVLGFSPRKAALVLYLGEDLTALGDGVAALGPHKAGKGCLYLKRLEDVDRPALARLLARVASMRASV